MAWPTKLGMSGGCPLKIWVLGLPFILGLADGCPWQVQNLGTLASHSCWSKGHACLDPNPAGWEGVTCQDCHLCALTYSLMARYSPPSDIQTHLQTPRPQGSQTQWQRLAQLPLLAKAGDTIGPLKTIAICMGRSRNSFASCATVRSVPKDWCRSESLGPWQTRHSVRHT